MNTGPKLVGVDFPNPPNLDHPGIRIPKGCRVLQLEGIIIRIPGDIPNVTRLLVHPDDVAMLKEANPEGPSADLIITKLA